MATKREIFEKLQQDILMWQGVRVQSAKIHSMVEGILSRVTEITHSQLIEYE